MATVKKDVPQTETKMAENELILPEARIELCAAKNDVRFYLNWAYLDLSEKKKPMLVATNGHILAAAPVTVGKNVKAGPIPVAAINAARVTKQKRAVVARLFFEGGMVGTGDIMWKRPEDVKYPDWRKVVPDTAREQPDIGFDGGYMKLAQKVLGNRMVKELGRSGIKVFCGRDGTKLDPTKPMLIRSFSPETADAIAVLMPMRI